MLLLTSMSALLCSYLGQAPNVKRRVLYISTTQCCFSMLPNTQLRIVAKGFQSSYDSNSWIYLPKKLPALFHLCAFSANASIVATEYSIQLQKQPWTSSVQGSVTFYCVCA